MKRNNDDSDDDGRNNGSFDNLDREEQIPQGSQSVTSVGEISICCNCCLASVERSL